jgi:hypothetical protein
MLFISAGVMTERIVLITRCMYVCVTVLWYVWHAYTRIGSYVFQCPSKAEIMHKYKV